MNGQIMNRSATPEWAWLLSALWRHRKSPMQPTPWRQDGPGTRAWLSVAANRSQGILARGAARLMKYALCLFSRSGLRLLLFWTMLAVVAERSSVVRLELGA